MSIGPQPIDPFSEAQSLSERATRPSEPAAAPAPAAASAATAHRWTQDQGGLVLMEALALAQRVAEQLSGRSVDSVVNSEPNDQGGWNIDIDVLEAKAKMGTNDLLSCFRIGLAPDGSLIGYSRLRRYHREDG